VENGSAQDKITVHGRFLILYRHVKVCSLRLIICLLAYRAALYLRQHYFSDWLSGLSRFEFYHSFFWPTLFCGLLFAYLEGFFADNFWGRPLNSRLYAELKIGFFSFCALSILAFGLSFHLFSRTFLLIFVLLQFLFFAALYFLFRKKSRRKKRVLCIGEEDFFRELKMWMARENLLYCFLDAGEISLSLLEKYEPDEILLCRVSEDRRREVFQLLSVISTNRPVELRDLSSLARIFSRHKDFGKYSNFLRMFFAEASAFDFGYRLKRVMDLVLVFLFLPIWLPLLLLISALLFLSGRRVFFPQLRVGQMGRLFVIYKFCTMKEKTADYEKPLDGTDPRVTAAGWFLRRTSLDELPQLINVLKGDMSLVGPRPEILQVVEKNYASIQWKRLLLKPGLTGLWQVYGRKQPIHDHLKYDFYYLKHRSIWLDIWILLMTVPAVIFKKGAA
jgi:lipopolysaccharide/colanic/teichoic acid biosynthesis glycosyltransferase